MFVPTHLKSLQALDLSLRSGSLKGAADQLAITPAAVGQRVKALEDYLGMELLLRGRSGLRPSAPLSAALEHLNAGFRALETAAAILDMHRCHEIRIGADMDFADLWLTPRLERFHRAHPHIQFSVNGEGNAPMRIAPMDCEITFATCEPQASVENLIQLFPDVVLPISSEENKRRLLKIRKRDRLEGFPLLHLDFYRNDPTVPDWAGWIAQQRLRRTAPQRGIRFRRIAAALEAVNAGAGLALCGVALISKQIDDGTISLPFSAAARTGTSHAFHARFRTDALKRPQVRRFQEWLLEESAKTRQWLLRFAGDGAKRRRSARSVT